MEYLELALAAVRQLIAENTEQETALFDQYGQWAAVSLELVGIHRRRQELKEQEARLNDEYRLQGG